MLLKQDLKVEINPESQLETLIPPPSVIGRTRPKKGATKATDFSNTIKCFNLIDILEH
jgi:hypothetical protein